MLGYLLCCICFFVCVVFFFKQKTAYEMRISDWSSDVCSSDLPSRSSFHSVSITSPFDSWLSMNQGFCLLGIAKIQNCQSRDRKSVVEGKSVSVRVALGGRRIIKKKNNREKAHQEKKCINKC